MTDNSIRKIIVHTIDCLPVSWEQLWIIFQRVIQMTCENRETIEIDAGNVKEMEKVKSKETQKKKK